MTILLETKRLIITLPSLLDLSNWSTLHNEEDAMQFLGGARDRREVMQWLESDITHYQKHGFTMGNVLQKSDNKFVGRAGLVYFNHNDKQLDIEIGFIFHKNYWHKGYGSEIANGIIDYGFAHLHLNYMIAVTRPDNKRSQQVLEKAGMHYLKNIIINDNKFWLYRISKN